MGNTTQSSPAFATMLIDNTWNYFAVSVYHYTVGSSRYCRLRFMSNVDTMNTAMNCGNGYNGFAITQSNKMTLTSFRSYIFNKVRIYNYALNIDELPSMVLTFSTNMEQNQCTKKLG